MGFRHHIRGYSGKGEFSGGGVGLRGDLPLLGALRGSQGMPSFFEKQPSHSSRRYGVR